MQCQANYKHHPEGEHRPEGIKCRVIEANSGEYTCYLCNSCITNFVHKGHKVKRLGTGGK